MAVIGLRLGLGSSIGPICEARHKSAPRQIGDIVRRVDALCASTVCAAHCVPARSRLKNHFGTGSEAENENGTVFPFFFSLSLGGERVSLRGTGFQRIPRSNRASSRGQSRERDSIAARREAGNENRVLRDAARAAFRDRVKRGLTIRCAAAPARPVARLVRMQMHSVHIARVPRLRPPAAAEYGPMKLYGRNVACYRARARALTAMNYKRKRRHRLAERSIFRRGRAFQVGRKKLRATGYREAMCVCAKREFTASEFRMKAVKNSHDRIRAKFTSVLGLSSQWRTHEQCRVSEREQVN